MNYFFFILLIMAIALCAIVLIWQRKRLTVLRKTLQEKIETLEKTSKLLIEKNLEIADQNIRLQKLLESKTDFIGIASHQLRTPATEVKWGIDMLRTGALGALTSAQTAHVEKIYEGVENMIQLIDKLLRMVMVEEGYKKLSFKPYNFDVLARDVVQKIAEEFKEKGIEIIYNLNFGDIPVVLDLDSMEMVISNLVENAFNYTPAKGTITLASKMTDKRELYFSIQDTGIGIPKSKQETVFKKFQRSKTAIEMYSGGIGLGLYIAKNIIEQYKGNIDFTSEEGKGTIFYFTVPTK